MTSKRCTAEFKAEAIKQVTERGLGSDACLIQTLATTASNSSGSGATLPRIVSEWFRGSLGPDALRLLVLRGSY